MSGEDAIGLDDVDDSMVIKLKAKGGDIYEIDAKSAASSKLITTALEDKDGIGDYIELKYIESAIVEKVVEFLAYHSTVPPKDIPKPLPTPDIAAHVGEWDAKFADVDQDTMFQVLLAANFMDIPPLLNLMCAKVASLMKEKTPEEIRKVFNIRAEYTPEEEEHVRKEYSDLLE